MMLEDSTFINTFANPWFLLLLPVPFLLLIWNLYRNRHAPAVLYSDLEAFASIRPSLRQRMLGIMPFTRSVALCLAVVALARPQFGSVSYDVNTMGVDIELVIDVSGSMQQQDFYPNRLEAAKRAASLFVDNRKTDRVGVTIFAQKAAILAPPTMDMEAVKMFLRAITDGMIDNSGTAIGDGMGLAIKKLEKSEADSKVIILLTDGEDNASSQLQPMQAAEIADALGIKVYTIGVGRLPRNGFMMAANQGGYDGELLSKIAGMTGARYYQANDSNRLEEIYAEIDQLEKTELEVNETAEYDERFMFFWFPGLALLGLEFLLRALLLRRLP